MEGDWGDSPHGQLATGAIRPTTRADGLTARHRCAAAQRPCDHDSMIDEEARAVRHDAMPKTLREAGVGLR